MMNTKHRRFGLAATLAACVLTTGLFMPDLKAQSVRTATEIAETARQDIEAAQIRNDFKALEEAKVLLERALVAYPGDAALLHYLGYAHYRIGSLNMESDTDAAEQHLETAQDYLERATEAHDWPESYALLSSVYGMRIGSNMLRGMRLGPKADGALKRAFELDESNPRVWMLSGTSDLYKPRMFGGGLDKAIDQLNKALSFFETDSPGMAQPAWGLAEAHVWLGMAHIQNKAYDDARAEFEKALELEPEYAWVREVLLPQLDGATPGR